MQTKQKRNEVGNVMELEWFRMLWYETIYIRKRECITNKMYCEIEMMIA